MSEQVPTKKLITAPENPTLEDLIAFYGDSNFRSGVTVRIPYRATQLALEEVQQLRKALKRAVSQCGHVYNCSAARGSERDCTCGWTAAKELARKLP